MKKFIIPTMPSSTNKSIRFPNNLIDEVEKAMEGHDCTFSAFVVAAVKTAMENLEEENGTKD